MGEKKGLQRERFEIGGSKIIVDRIIEKETKIIIGAGESVKMVLLPGKSSWEKTLEIRLEGDRSRVEILAAIVGQGDNEIFLTTRVIHAGIGTSAYTHVRGVLFDQSRLRILGSIKIEKGANQTSSLLENRVLILGEAAKAEAVPSLEISADDIKASHAATIGKINEMELFYLQSRGIDRKTATRMIADGFFEPVLSKIEDESAAANIRGSLWVDILKTQGDIRTAVKEDIRRENIP